MDFVDPRHEMASIQRERPPIPLAQDRARTRINIDLIIAEGAVVRCSRFNESEALPGIAASCAKVTRPRGSSAWILSMTS